MKHQSSAPLSFLRGIHRWPVNSSHKWPVTRKMFPFDDVIMQRHDMDYNPIQNIPFFLFMPVTRKTKLNSHQRGDHEILLILYFDQETLLTLYHTFVYPYLNYCIHVWGKAYNVHIYDLIVLQHKAVRIVHGVPPRTNTQRLCFDSNILSLKRLYS